MMNDKTKLSQAERDLLKQAMGDVTPLRQTKKIHIPSSKKPAKKHHHRGHGDGQQANNDEYPHQILKPDDNLSFARAGVNHHQMMQLQCGDLAIDAWIDLHGKRYQRAKSALSQFIQQHRHCRCVLVIHGKGSREGQGSIIKSLVNEQLRQLTEVMAFHSAQACDGGTGAVYVLLKSPARSK